MGSSAGEVREAEVLQGPDLGPGHPRRVLQVRSVPPQQGPALERERARRQGRWQRALSVRSLRWGLGRPEQLQPQERGGRRLAPVQLRASMVALVLARVQVEGPAAGWGVTSSRYGEERHQVRGARAPPSPGSRSARQQAQRPWWPSPSSVVRAPRAGHPDGGPRRLPCGGRGLPVHPRSMTSGS